MRAWFWTLLVAGLAVALAMVLHDHGGNVLILVPPWRIELSLTLAALLGLGAIIMTHVSLRLLGWLSGSPRRIRLWRALRARERDQALLESSWIGVLEGRGEQARKDLSRLLMRAQSAQRQVLTALALARVQHHGGQYAERNQTLEQAHAAANTPRLQTVSVVCAAAMWLDHGSAQEALTLLQTLPDARARDPYALRLLLQAHRQLGHHEQVHELTRLLWRRGVLDKAQALQEIEVCVAARLTQGNTQAFKNIWATLKSEERALPAVALRAAAILQDQNHATEAARILEAAIAAHGAMDARLLAAYARCPPEQVAHRLSCAEAWLKAHSDHPEVLATLGKLCLIGQLWGQGERYLLRSLRLRQDPHVIALLGNLYDRIGRPEDAVRHWRQVASAGVPTLAQDHVLPAADMRGDPGLLDAQSVAQEETCEDFSPIAYHPTRLEGTA